MKMLLSQAESVSDILLLILPFMVLTTVTLLALRVLTRNTTNWHLGRRAHG